MCKTLRIRARHAGLWLAVFALLALATLTMDKPAAHAGESVNLYSYRQPFLIKLILKSFTEKTGIKTNIVFARKGMLEKIKATPGAADAVLTVDIGRLHDMGRGRSVAAGEVEGAWSRTSPLPTAIPRGIGSASRCAGVSYTPARTA